jgi:hypothetical protein
MRPTRAASTLDFDYVRRICIYIAVIGAITGPFSPDPVALIGGSIVPWVLVRIIGTPTMPAAVLYIFLWQWMQVFARALQSCVDKESLSTSIYGPDVTRAYWYMMASLVVMAFAFRAVLGNLKPPTRAQATAHFRWQVPDVVMVYAGAMVISIVASFAVRAVPALAQVLDGVARLKVVALVLLFVYCMSTGRGQTFMLGVILFEILIGFTGFLSDFRGVFIYLGISALAARVKLKGTTMVAALVGVLALVSLAMFWTSVKMEYRVFAAQSDESQEIKVPLSERLAFLGERAMNPGKMDMSMTSYMLLSRLAYTDIFASVITVQDASPEPVPLRQWTEAIQHVVQPRFIFKDKPALSDTEVYMRLARAFTSENMREGTSISVGYMGENYADLGFPGMLLGMFVLGLMLSGVIRTMMNFNLPQALKEGIIMGFAFSMARDGVEVSLPKVLGGMLMFFLIYLGMNKVLFPRVVQWLDQRAATANVRHSRLKLS